MGRHLSCASGYQRNFCAPGRRCPVAGQVPLRPTSFPANEVNALMSQAMRAGATLEEATRKTELALTERYGTEVPSAPCPAGGSRAPIFLQHAFSKVPRPI